MTRLSVANYFTRLNERTHKLYVNENHLAIEPTRFANFKSAASTLTGMMIATYATNTLANSGPLIFIGLVLAGLIIAASAIAENDKKISTKIHYEKESYLKDSEDLIFAEDINTIEVIYTEIGRKRLEMVEVKILMNNDSSQTILSHYKDEHTENEIKLLAKLTNSPILRSTIPFD